MDDILQPCRIIVNCWEILMHWMKLRMLWRTWGRPPLWYTQEHSWNTCFSHIYAAATDIKSHWATVIDYYLISEFLTHSGAGTTNWGDCWRVEGWSLACSHCRTVLYCSSILFSPSIDIWKCMVVRGLAPPEVLSTSGVNVAKAFPLLLLLIFISFCTFMSLIARSDGGGLVWYSIGIEHSNCARTAEVWP